MGTNDYPFTRLYQYIKNDPLYRDQRCDWFVQCGSCEVDEPPASGVVEKLIPRADMEDLVKRSALVISHCGIGSLNLMLQYRKRVIFVPRVAQHDEFSDDHQLQIAREIKNRRMSVVYPDDNFPLLALDQIELDNKITSPVDITNYDLARIVEMKLTA
jgi:UDP-N-acetylglucosamine transferase subunit ALG13